MTGRERRAVRLGSRDAMAGKPMPWWDAGGDAELMDELGETGPTTERNWDARRRLMDAYDEGYDGALAAMGGRQ